MYAPRGAREGSCQLVNSGLSFGEGGEGEEGAREGKGKKGFFLLTSPSSCGCDKCPFQAHQFGQLRPGQAEALCT